MMWRLVFGPSRFCAPDAMFLGEGTRHFGCRFGLRTSSTQIKNKRIHILGSLTPPAQNERVSRLTQF